MTYSSLHVLQTLYVLVALIPVEIRQHYNVQLQMSALVFYRARTPVIATNLRLRNVDIRGIMSEAACPTVKEPSAWMEYHIIERQPP